MWVAKEEALEMETDQIKAILSVTDITFNGSVEIEYNSGKKTFPSEATHALPIFNVYIR